MGHLIRLPAACCDAGMKFAADSAKKIKNLKAKVKVSDREEIGESALSGEQFRNDRMAAVVNESVGVVRTLKDWFAEVTIRRGTDSLDYRGDNVITLYPFVDIDAFLLLTPRELEALRMDSKLAACG